MVVMNVGIVDSERERANSIGATVVKGLNALLNIFEYQFTIYQNVELIMEDVNKGAVFQIVFSLANEENAASIQKGVGKLKCSVIGLIAGFSSRKVTDVFTGIVNLPITTEALQEVASSLLFPSPDTVAIDFEIPEVRLDQRSIKKQISAGKPTLKRKSMLSCSNGARSNMLHLNALQPRTNNYSVIPVDNGASNAAMPVECISANFPQPTIQAGPTGSIVPVPTESTDIAGLLMDIPMDEYFNAEEEPPAHAPHTQPQNISSNAASYGHPYPSMQIDGLYNDFSNVQMDPATGANTSQFPPSAALQTLADDYDYHTEYRTTGYSKASNAPNPNTKKPKKQSKSSKPTAEDDKWFDIFGTGKAMVAYNCHTHEVVIMNACTIFRQTIGMSDNHATQCMQNVANPSVGYEYLIPMKDLTGAASCQHTYGRLVSCLKNSEGNKLEYLNLYRIDNKIPLSCHITLIALKQRPATDCTDDIHLAGGTSLRYGILTLRSASVVGNSKFCAIGMLPTTSVDTQAKINALYLQDVSSTKHKYIDHDPTAAAYASKGKKKTKKANPKKRKAKAKTQGEVSRGLWGMQFDEEWCPGDSQYYSY